MEDRLKRKPDNKQYEGISSTNAELGGDESMYSHSPEIMFVYGTCNTGFFSRRTLCSGTTVFSAFVSTSETTGMNDGKGTVIILMGKVGNVIILN